LPGHLHHIATGEALAAALFLMGLVGGVAHCAPMCGPFVLMQLGREPKGAVLQRLAGWLLLPYQLGRATTYALLGALAGGFGHLLVAATGWRWLLAVLLLAGAALFLLEAFRRAAAGRVAGRFGAALGRFVAPLLDDPRGLRGYGLGLALGLLPCGFLYAAVAASAGAGSAVGGAAAMASFALGTAFSLVAVAILGRAAVLRWRPFAARLATPLLLVNAALLSALALLT
jgi:uncharacterized protein